MLKDYAKVQPEVRKDIADAIQKVEAKNQKAEQYKYTRLQSHTHNNIDSLPVNFANLTQKILPVHWTVIGAAAATAANYTTFWTAPFKCVVIGMTEIHQAAASAAGAVGLQLEKLTGTTAPDSGIELLVDDFDLEATANTLQTAQIVTTYTSGIRNATLAKGDRLCLKDIGTLTSLSNVSVMVLIQY